MGSYNDVFLLTGPQAELLFNKRLGEEPNPVVRDSVLNFVHGAELFALLRVADEELLRIAARIERAMDDTGIDVEVAA